MRRAALLLSALLLGWSVAGVAAAGPAAAHASLVSTDPGEGARLETVPAEVTLEFSEGVSLGAGYARVLSSDGERVDTGTAAVEGRSVCIPRLWRLRFSASGAALVDLVYRLGERVRYEYVSAPARGC